MITAIKISSFPRAACTYYILSFDNARLNFCQTFSRMVLKKILALPGADPFLSADYFAQMSDMT